MTKSLDIRESVQKQEKRQTVYSTTILDGYWGEVPLFHANIPQECWNLHLFCTSFESVWALVDFNTFCDVDL